nr:hypothetical protein BaRGS_021047 [Batillaria attramentaria]
MPFLSFLVQPLVGAAADRWLKHKAVLVTATVLTGLFHLLFLAVPPRTPAGAVSAGVYLTNKEGQKLDYTIMFSAYCVLCQISALIAFFIRIPTDVRCGHILKNTLRLLTLPKVTCFLLVIFYFGFMLGSIVSFLFWYLLDLGAPAYMFGLTRVFCVLCEIPVFTVSGRLVKRFGPIPILCVAIVTLSIRLLVYSLLRNPWLVLLVEPLHGVTFCLMITAATTYASVEKTSQQIGRYNVP